MAVDPPNQHTRIDRAAGCGGQKANVGEWGLFLTHPKPGNARKTHVPARGAAQENDIYLLYFVTTRIIKPTLSRRGGGEDGMDFCVEHLTLWRNPPPRCSSAL